MAVEGEGPDLELGPGGIIGRGQGLRLVEEGEVAGVEINTQGPEVEREVTEIEGKELQNKHND